LVDKDGRKVSHRDIWNSSEFKDFTGYTHENGTGGMVSEGTMSYNMNVKIFSIPVLSEQYNGKKFTLCEPTLFVYHKDITGRINPEIPFGEFSREKNRGYGHKKKKYDFKLKNSKNVLNDISKEFGLPIRSKHFSSLNEFKEYMIFRFTEDKFKVVYEKVVKNYV